METRKKPETIETTIQRLFRAPVVEAPPLSDTCLGIHQFVYIPLFWRPYLGVVAYGLWEICKATQGTTKLELPIPTIEMMGAMLGGDRVTILGRAAAGRNKAQEGALTMLLREKIAWHTRTGKGGQTEHRIEARPFLPILAPKQVITFTPRLRDYHELFLGAVRGFDLPAWRKRPESTFVGG